MVNKIVLNQHVFQSKCWKIDVSHGAHGAHITNTIASSFATLSRTLLPLLIEDVSHTYINFTFRFNATHFFYVVSHSQTQSFFTMRMTDNVDS